MTSAVGSDTDKVKNHFFVDYVINLQYMFKARKSLGLFVVNILPAAIHSFFTQSS